MRIIAGQWRGRRLQAPTGRDTRPTSDRVREALFSSIHSRIGSFAELRVLDAFAGSGALGLEALSRGAAFLVAVESDPKACRIVESNYNSLQGGLKQDSMRGDLRDANQESISTKEQFRLYRGDIFKVASYPQERGLQGLAVDLAFFDPPYDLSIEKLCGLLQILAEKVVFAHGALLIIERAKPKRGTEEITDLLPEGISILDVKTKGETTLYFASFLP